MDVNNGVDPSFLFVKLTSAFFDNNAFRSVKLLLTSAIYNNDCPLLGSI